MKRGWTPEKYGSNKQKKEKKDIDPKYNFLRRIRNNPKKIEMHDLETDKTVLYPSTTRLLWSLIKIPE